MSSVTRLKLSLPHQEKSGDFSPALKQYWNNNHLDQQCFYCLPFCLHLLIITYILPSVLIWLFIIMTLKNKMSAPLCQRLITEMRLHSRELRGIYSEKRKLSTWSYFRTISTFFAAECYFESLLLLIDEELFIYDTCLSQNQSISIVIFQAHGLLIISVQY